MNPPLSLPVLVPLLVCVIAAGLFFSWRSSRELPVSRRLLLLAIRAFALAGVALLALNFGSWESPKNILQRPWVVMVDNSFSMTVADDGNGRMRSQGASESVSVIARQAKQSGVPLAVHLFDSSLHAAQGEYAATNPIGKETRLADSLTQLLQETGATGNPPAGVIVLSDGRQTISTPASLLAELGLRAKAQQTPVYTLLMGN
ncbi:MAG: hypothetical protein LBV12_09780, partial [Puniceicoccales bacterium]|nr:hypothetical protein [Puniceicoccales bacterium]